MRAPNPRSHPLQYVFPGVVTLVLPVRLTLLAYKKMTAMGRRKQDEYAPPSRPKVVIAVIMVRA